MQRSTAAVPIQAIEQPRSNIETESEGFRFGRVSRTGRLEGSESRLLVLLSCHRDLRIERFRSDECLLKACRPPFASNAVTPRCGRDVQYRETARASEFPETASPTPDRENSCLVEQGFVLGCFCQYHLSAWASQSSALCCYPGVASRPKPTKSL